MGQGAGRPAAPSLLTVDFEDGLGRATAGSFLHGLACLETAAPLEDTPVLRCEVEALRVHSTAPSPALPKLEHGLLIVVMSSPSSIRWTPR